MMRKFKVTNKEINRGRDNKRGKILEKIKGYQI